MFKWTYSKNVTTEATPEQIWSIWQDVSSWPCWDSELKWVKLNGNFTEGTTGRMKPTNGPEVDFILSRVEPYKAFSNKAKLPFTNLVFDHEYFGPSNKGVPAHIRHSVTMTGWLAPIFARLIGSKIKHHLQSAMTELSNSAMKDDKAMP